ncbi:MAG: hypothetical protein ACE5KM_13790 [Planctomycetaceae bacterium]
MSRFNFTPSIHYSQFFDRSAVIKRLKRSELGYLRRAGGTTRKIARNSIKRKGHSRRQPTNRSGAAFRRWLEEIRRRPASPPGSPPFTHDGTFRNAIAFGLDGRESVLIGFLKNKVDDLAELHEFGGRRKGKTYPARPTMHPALEKVSKKLPQFYREAFA